MPTWIFYVLACAVAAFGGYEWAAAHYEKDISDLRLEYESKAKAQAEENQRQGEENARRLAEAVAERDDALARIGDVSDDADGVRREAVAFGLKMPGSDTDSCKPCREKLAESVKLLSESADLLEEGASLLTRVAADKDAVVKIRRF